MYVRTTIAVRRMEGVQVRRCTYCFPFVQLYGKLLHFEDSASDVKSMFNFALQLLPGTVFHSLQYLPNFTRYARRKAQIEIKRDDKC